VEKEYQRLEEERAGEEQSAEKSIADVATRMEELEGKKKSTGAEAAKKKSGRIATAGIENSQ
jgi:hypothetical protein